MQQPSVNQNFKVGNSIVGIELQKYEDDKDALQI